MLAVGTVAGAYLLTRILRNSVGVIASDLEEAFHLTATQTGVMSGAFFLAYAAAQIPASIVIARAGAAPVLCGGAVLMGLGTMFFSAGQTYPELLAARAVLGLGASPFFVGSMTILMSLVPPERFAMASGAQLATGRLGTMLATAPLAFVVDRMGWRGTFVGLAAACAALAAGLALVMLRRRAERDAKRQSWSDIRSGFAALFRMGAFLRLPALYGTSVAVGITLLGAWGGPWLSNVYQLGLVARGAALLPMGVTFAAGAILWGSLARLAGGHRLPVRIGALLTAALLLLAALVPLPRWTVVAWLAALGLTTSFAPLVLAQAKAVLPGPVAVEGVSLLNVLAMVIAFALPTLSGVVVDRFGGMPGHHPPEAFRAIFALLAGALLAALVPYWGSVDPTPGGPATTGHHHPHEG